MKKILYSILIMLSLFILIPKVNADDKENVKVYILSAEGCSACARARTYFNELKASNPDLFEIVEYEVFDSHWNVQNKKLNQLRIALLEHYEEDTAIATPVIVVGDYLQVGVDDIEDMEDRIKNYQNEGYVDMVEKIAKENNINLDKIYEEEGKYDLLIIGGIFIVLIGAFAWFIHMSKK